MLYFKLNNENINSENTTNILIENQNISNIEYNIEYFNGEFKTYFIEDSEKELEKIISSSDTKELEKIISSLEIKVNQTAFGIPVSTQHLSLNTFSVEEASTERLYAQEIHFGNWKLTGISDGRITFSLADENPWKANENNIIVKNGN